MHAVIGTIPDAKFPLVCGPVSLRGDQIRIDRHEAPVNRGTPALLAAAIKASDVLGQPGPVGYLVGDIGLGHGSRALYAQLNQDPALSDWDLIAFHYLQPDVDWHNRIMNTILDLEPRPLLIADAGYMYAAKMGGMADVYDLFTPDAGELAFLADEEAPHPFYTRGFILHENAHLPQLIERAYQHGNAAKHLLVKGQQDMVVAEKQVVGTVDHPSVEAMEAMGGTGDTVTGIVTALIASGLAIPEACIIASKTNRLAGFYASPTPAGQVLDIIHHIPVALETALKSHSA